MDILAVEVVNRQDLTAYTPAALIPTAAVAQLAAGRMVYLRIHTTTLDYTVDLRTVLNRVTGFTALTAWPDLATVVTTADAIMVPWPGTIWDLRYLDEAETRTGLYETKFPANLVGDRLRVIPLDPHHLAQVSLGNSAGEVYPRNRSFRRFLPDIRFEWFARPHLPDLNQLIPVCGGSLYRPLVVDTTTMYAVGAAATLRGTSKQAPEQMMLDFTPLGGITILSFSELTITDDGNNLVITLPTTVSEHAVIPVIYGRMLFEGELGIARPENRTLIIPNRIATRLSSRLAVAHSQQHTIFGSLTLQHRYASSATLVADHTCFLIVLERATLYRHRTTEWFSLGQQMHAFANTAAGFLQERVTGTIRDSYLLQYPHIALRSVTEQWPLLVPQGTDLDHHMAASGYLWTRDNPTAYTDLTQQGWQMVELMNLAGG